MLVTEICMADKKRKKVYLDYEYAFTLYNSEIKRYKVECGKEIDTDSLDAIKDILSKRVKARSLYLLKSSDKTEKQLYDMLFRSGYGDYYCSIGVEYLKSFGYIDDKRYAINFVNSCNGKRSRKDIYNRLIARGIPSHLAKEVIEDGGTQEVEAVYASLKKKSIYPEDIQDLDRDKKNKIYAYLLRKGFSASVICAILNNNL